MKTPLYWKRDIELEREANALLRKQGYKGKAVSVYWNPRMRTTAGIAYPQRPAVALNPKPRLLEESGSIETTLKHELAHILAWHRSGRKRIQAHGSKWKQACADLGIPDEKRCHDYQELEAYRTKQARKYFYECSHCLTPLSRVRPFKRKQRLACIICCKRYNGGRFDPKYEFRLISKSSVAA